MSDKTVSIDFDSLDVNDAFDSLTLAEEHLSSNGFKEGFEKGKIIGEVEGYHLGYHRGAELGAEIGFYKGFLQAFINTADSKILSSHNNIVEKFNRLITSFPRSNDETVDIVLMRDQIRSLYKRLCSLLKTDCYIPEDSKLSF